MDYNQASCKTYFNTNTFYYEPPINDLSVTESRHKTFNGESNFLENDHSLRQPTAYCEAAVVYTNLDDKEDFYVINRPFDSHHHHPPAQLVAYSGNLPIHQSSHYPAIHGGSAVDQTELTTSVQFANNNQPNQLQTSAPFSNVPASTALQPLHHHHSTMQPLQLQHAAPNQIGQTVASTGQQTTKQLSVNLSMNMTMDIKSMEFKPIQTADPSDYNHVMNDVVSNVANKLVTNFNTNLLSPTGQKDYQLCTQTSQSYAGPTKTHSQFPFSYNHQNNSNYNQRYHNSSGCTNESATTNHHLLNQYANSGPFDELTQFRHFNHIQLNNNDCYELANPNWSVSNNSSSLTTLTSSSLASNNLASLNSSFSNGSLASNEINDNDYLINYSNNFLSSISVGSKSIGLVEPAEKELVRSKRKLQLNNLAGGASYLSNSLSDNLEADNQKVYFKIENNEIRSSREKQELNCVLRTRSNSNALHRPDRFGREIDFYQCDKLDKKMKAIGGRSGNLCLLCGKSYARPSTLKTHLRTHSNDRPFKCSICYKSFSQAANLTAHQRVHSGEKPFTCHVCYRKFSQSSSVTTHMRTHSGERPYSCGMCRKAFSDSSTLTKHLRIHSGEKPYQCSVCLLKFSQSGNLNRHMRIHNNFQ